MAIKRTLVETRIAHGPNNEYQGATQVFKREVEEEGKTIGKLEDEFVPVSLEELPKLLPDAAEHIKRNVELETQIDAERGAAKADCDALKAQITELEAKLAQATALAESYAGRILAATKALAGPQET